MKKLIAILLIVISAGSYAQNMQDLALYKVHINQPDKNIIAQIRPVGSLPRAEPGKVYYWFSSNTIKQTQGSYSGHLLNGPYMEFYLNKNLKEQGEFRKGLKTGVWKNWAPKGVLLQEVNWKDGVKDGAFVLYDDKGQLKQKGVYKNDSVSPEKKPTSFWGRINIFKKRNKKA